MTRLLASDLYRLSRARWPRAVLVLIAVATLGCAVFVRLWPLGPGLVFEGVTGSAGALRLGGRGSSVALVATIAPFVAAHISCADSDGGFDRALLASLRGRVPYHVEKYLVVALATGTMLVAYLVLGALGALVSGVPVVSVEPPWQIAAWAGEAWVLSCAYALVVLLVGQLSRSRVIAFTFAFLLASAMIEQGLLGITLLAGKVVGLDWEAPLELASAWAPYVTLASVENGAADMLAADATGVAPAVRALVVCVPLCLALIAIGPLATARRDVP